MKSIRQVIKILSRKPTKQERNPNNEEILKPMKDMMITFLNAMLEYFSNTDLLYGELLRNKLEVQTISNHEIIQRMKQLVYADRLRIDRNEQFFKLDIFQTYYGKSPFKSMWNFGLTKDELRVVWEWIDAMTLISSHIFDSNNSLISKSSSYT